MNILYTCDDNYIWLMGISVISLFENNKQISELDVYILGENISKKNKEIIYGIGIKYHRKIELIDIPIIDIPDSLISIRWPLSAYTRLFAGRLLPDDIEKVLYLDCDTIIKGDIEQLETIDINDNIFYGIKDCISSTYKKNIGLKKDAIYINAGVLLINLNLLRKFNIKKEIDKYMVKYIERINYADQDILNGVFDQRIGILKPCYDVMTIDVVYSYNEILRLRRPTNYYSEKELQEAVSDPIIIHYTTNMRVVRPWFINTDHPLAFEFKRYMEISPWDTMRLSEMYFTSSSDKFIGAIEKLPKNISLTILGIIHSKLKPLYIRFKSIAKNAVNEFENLFII